MNNSRLLPGALLLGCLALTACSGPGQREDSPKKKPDAVAGTPGARATSQLSEQDLRKEADRLYRHARRQLDDAAYTTAVVEYDQLVARYPFTDYGTQAELEKAYAQYKSLQYDDAISTAERFLREHPRHPRVDYAQYLKGLANFDRNSSFLDILPVDASKSDVSYARLSFNDFALLIQKYPNSRYNADARLRMVWLRNRIAQHELGIVHYYMSRGAWIAAAKRAEEIIREYPGAPATGEALEQLHEAYKNAGITQEANDAQRLLAANEAVTHPVKGKPTTRDVVLAAAPAPAALPAGAGRESAATASTASAADAQSAAAAPEQSHGALSWFAHLFSGFDSSKDDYGYTIIIPTGNGPTADASGNAQTADGGTGTGAGKVHTLSGHGLHVTVGPDPSEEWHPVDEKPAADQTTPSAADSAPPGDNSSAPPAPAAPAATKSPAPKAAKPAAPAATTENNSQGFFTRVLTGFAGLFSVFDPNHGQPADSDSTAKPQAPESGQ